MKSMPRTGKNKGKRWKKGHSSTSNPESNRFREAAKNRFFSANTGISPGVYLSCSVGSKSPAQPVGSE